MNRAMTANNWTMIVARGKAQAWLREQQEINRLKGNFSCKIS